MDLKHMVVEYIFNDEMKAKVVKELNDNINIPIISEKTEEKILDAIYDSVEDVIKTIWPFVNPCAAEVTTAGLAAV